MSTLQKIIATIIILLIVASCKNNNNQVIEYDKFDGHHFDSASENEEIQIIKKTQLYNFDTLIIERIKIFFDGQIFIFNDTMSLFDLSGNSQNIFNDKCLISNLTNTSDIIKFKNLFFRNFSIQKKPKFNNNMRIAVLINYKENNITDTLIFAYSTLAFYNDVQFRYNIDIIDSLTYKFVMPNYQACNK